MPDSNSFTRSQPWVEKWNEQPRSGDRIDFFCKADAIGLRTKKLQFLNDFSDGIRNRSRFEIRGIDTHHRDISCGEVFTGLIIEDRKIVSDSLVTKELRIQTHADGVSCPDRL